MEKVNVSPDGVHVLYKKLGETPLETISSFKKENPQYENVPMTYAGRLDPMAEGLLLVLSGDMVHKKDAYLGLDKTYVVEVLWGIETDTLDVLGKLTKFESCKLESEEIKKVLESLSGKFMQSYPAYSSRPVNGKPLFEWAREGRLSEIEIPKHEVELYSAQYLSRTEISKKDLMSDIEEKIRKVSGDFRQEEVLASWQEAMSKTVFDIFVVDTIEMSVSSGFYVRQFVSDMAQKVGASAVTFHIKRTKVGGFNLS